MGRSKHSAALYVENDGVFITDPEGIANYFNNYFISKVEKFRSGMCPNTSASYDAILSKIMSEKNHSVTFSFSQVDRGSVGKILAALPDGKASGMDHLDSRLIRVAAEALSFPIAHLVNLSLLQGIFPEKWKEAKIIPLPKNKRATFTGQNSRPISLLPLLSKVMEKIAFEQVYKYFFSNRLITKYQHAYREGHSTCTALTHMTDNWLEEIDANRLVGAVMLDFSAAFDLIDHKILLQKLECYGFTPLSLSWMGSYLSNRKQRVFFNGQYSSIKTIHCGVPQGSCLGPLLYSIFTNDLPFIVKHSTVVMYADDSTLYCSAKTPHDVSNLLNHDLQNIGKWVKDNKLALNVDKSTSMIFWKRSKLITEPSLNLLVNGLQLRQVMQAKLLGVTLDSYLSWSAHIDGMIVKMGNGIAMSRKCMSYIPMSIAKQVVQSLVLCHLENCPIIWSSASQKDLRKLQVAQNRAARTVLQCSLKTNVALMHTRLSWLTVDDKIKLRLTLILWNAVFMKQPQFLSEQLVFVGSGHLYATRQALGGDIKLPLPRTNFLKRTSFYRAISIWNRLSVSSRRVQNKYKFKRTVTQELLQMTS